jgi:hypothetical protein
VVAEDHVERVELAVELLVGERASVEIDRVSLRLGDEPIDPVVLAKDVFGRGMLMTPPEALSSRPTVDQKGEEVSAMAFHSVDFVCSREGASLSCHTTASSRALS